MTDKKAIDLENNVRFVWYLRVDEYHVKFGFVVSVIIDTAHNIIRIGLIFVVRWRLYLGSYIGLEVFLSFPHSNQLGKNLQLIFLRTYLHRIPY